MNLVRMGTGVKPSSFLLFYFFFGYFRSRRQDSKQLEVVVKFVDKERHTHTHNYTQGFPNLDATLMRQKNLPAILRATSYIKHWWYLRTSNSCSFPSLMSKPNAAPNPPGLFLLLRILLVDGLP